MILDRVGFTADQIDLAIPIKKESLIFGKKFKEVVSFFNVQFFR